MTELVLRQYPTSKEWWYFSNPIQVIKAHYHSDVLDALNTIETQVNSGYYAVGFLSYEAASAFDPAITTYADSAFPLLWFGLYDEPKILSYFELANLRSHQAYKLGTWLASTSPDEFKQAVNRVRAYIAKGETYQVNYTFRLQTCFQGDAWSLFLDLLQAQPQSYASFLDIGHYSICSVSPELFFHRSGSKVTTKPMKGTAKRGYTQQQDQQQAEWLRSSAKNRAENLMIVDMLRNDLGKVAQVGSVDVPQLFEIERYPTLWQMTSTVTAETNASTTDILRHLFPCASITGAPKVRTTDIIHELESGPRRIYTGGIGYIAPKRRAQFNVAIRTVLVDRVANTAEYGVGSGVTWDSNDHQEYEECLAKTQVLQSPNPHFSLLETMLWMPQSGYFLLTYHLKRLQDSAYYFGFRLDLNTLKTELNSLAFSFTQPTKVRLLLNADGDWELKTSLLDQATTSTQRRIRLASKPINPDNRFLYHKTTERHAYEQARNEHPDCDDVLLWNINREVTESCIANVIVQYRSRWLTPPVHSGLLAGTYRAWLLDQGKVEEAVIPLEMLDQCEQIFLTNSIRGCQLAKLIRD